MTLLSFGPVSAIGSRREEAVLWTVVVAASGVVDVVIDVDSVVDALLIVDDTRGSMRDVYSKRELSRGVIVLTQISHEKIICKISF